MTRPPTVLVVEDERQIREVVASALADDELEIREAATIRHATAQVAAAHPDLVILDLGLPDHHGVDFIRDYRAWSAVPILVLTARTLESDKIAALDAGADDYLTKPFSIAELRARVRALLRRRALDQATTTPIIRFGEFTLDCAARTVCRGNTPIHLTQIEYRLLAFLASNPGRVLTYRRLLQQVWGGAGSDNHQYVRVYVGHLRQKIEHNPATPRHVVTEIGVGYRFQP